MRYSFTSYRTYHGPWSFAGIASKCEIFGISGSKSRKRKANGRSDMTWTNSASAEVLWVFFNKITWKKDFSKKIWFFSWFEIGCSFWKLCWWEWLKLGSNYSRFCNAIFEMWQLFTSVFAFHMACFVGCNGHIHTCDTAFESSDYIVLPKIFFRPKRIFYGSRKANNFHLWVQLTFEKANIIHPHIKLFTFLDP